MMLFARFPLQQAAKTLLSGSLLSPSWTAWNGSQACLPLIQRQAATLAEARSKIIFLGTPQDAADVLKDLVGASKDGQFEVCAVVTKAGSDDKKSKAKVAGAALTLGFTHDQIFTPASAKEPEFLAAMARLAPDLCVTAGYGLMLPQAFLDIPRCGTVNIHPSLLPKYRGAAPVARALLAGETETGVSLAYTVLKCDAGPVLEQARVQLSGEEQGPELQSALFKMGSGLLLKRMGDILAGKGLSLAKPQDEAQATSAPKLLREDGQLDLTQTAQQVHNKIRALAGSPGTYLDVILYDLREISSTKIQLHVTRSRVVPAMEFPKALLTASVNRVHFMGRRMLLPCGDETLLEVLEIMPRVFNPERNKPEAGSTYMKRLGKSCRLAVDPPPVKPRKPPPKKRRP